MVPNDEGFSQPVSFPIQSVQSPPCPCHSGPQENPGTGLLWALWSFAASAHPSRTLSGKWGRQSTKNCADVLIFFVSFHQKNCLFKYTCSMCKKHFDNGFKTNLWDFIVTGCLSLWKKKLLKLMFCEFFIEMICASIIVYAMYFFTDEETARGEKRWQALDSRTLWLWSPFFCGSLPLHTVHNKKRRGKTYMRGWCVNWSHFSEYVLKFYQRITIFAAFIVCFHFFSHKQKHYLKQNLLPKIPSKN